MVREVKRNEHNNRLICVAQNMKNIALKTTKYEESTKTSEMWLTFLRLHHKSFKNHYKSENIKFNKKTPNVLFENMGVCLQFERKHLTMSFICIGINVLGRHH